MSSDLVFLWQHRGWGLTLRDPGNGKEAAVARREQSGKAGDMRTTPRETRAGAKHTLPVPTLGQITCSLALSDTLVTV